MLDVELEESAGAAGADVDESVGALGEVDCCLAQATRARALRHNNKKLRFIGSPHCMSGSNRLGSFTVPGRDSTFRRKRRSIAAFRTPLGKPEATVLWGSQQAQ